MFKKRKGNVLEAMAAAKMASMPEPYRSPQTIKEVAKERNSMSLDVRIEKKKIDGEEIVTATVSCNDIYNNIGGKSPMREEFTDMDKVKNKIEEMIDEFSSGK